jgi:hypothetical protein
MRGPAAIPSLAVFSLYYQRIDRGWPAVQSQPRAAQAAPGPGAALDRFGRSSILPWLPSYAATVVQLCEEGFHRLLNWFSGRIDARDFNAFGRNGFGNKILQVVWTGARYSLTDKLDVIAAYYHYTQNSYYGTPTTGPVPCSGMEHAQCAGTFNAISGVIDWQFAPKWDLYAGLMFSKVNSGLANGYLQRNNIDPTAGLRFRF